MNIECGPRVMAVIRIVRRATELVFASLVLGCISIFLMCALAAQLLEDDIFFDLFFRSWHWGTIFVASAAWFPFNRRFMR